MKICCTCKQEKHESEFYKRHREKDGLNRSCKICAEISSNRSKSKNKNKYYDISKKSDQKLRREMTEYKVSKGCLHCGENHPAVLELHHLDPLVKEFNPSDAGGRRRFYEEVEKCIVLCSNCHRKVHWTRD